MNESLLAMSFDGNVNGNIDQHSDTLNNGDNHVEIENESSSKGKNHDDLDELLNNISLFRPGVQSELRGQ